MKRVRQNSRSRNSAWWRHDDDVVYFQAPFHLVKKCCLTPFFPFTLLEGAEYDAARTAADQANRALHAADDSLAGWQLHEIQPVKFGGSPTDIANKMPLPAGAHGEVTNWWNALLRNLTRTPAGTSP